MVDGEAGGVGGLQCYSVTPQCYSVRWLGGVGGLQDLVEKHRAIFEDALPGNFSANDRISVCSARRIFSTFFMQLGLCKEWVESCGLKVELCGDLELVKSVENWAEKWKSEKKCQRRVMS